MTHIHTARQTDTSRDISHLYHKLSWLQVATELKKKLTIIITTAEIIISDLNFIGLFALCTSSPQLVITSVRTIPSMATRYHDTRGATIPIPSTDTERRDVTSSYDVMRLSYDIITTLHRVGRTTVPSPAIRQCPAQPSGSAQPSHQAVLHGQLWMQQTGTPVDESCSLGRWTDG